MYTIHQVLPHPAPTTASVSPMAWSATFSGAAEDCSGFLLQCSLYFESQAHLFSTECARVVLIISLLSGRALQWAQSLCESNAPVKATINDFFSHFREVFGQNTADLSVHDQLFSLHQGEETVNMYALRFRTLAAASGWNEMALITAFRQGLNPQVKQLMVVYDDSVGLENLIQKPACTWRI